MSKTITWTPKKVAVKDIKHTPNNYKIKTDLGRERLQASLKSFGLAGTVVVNTDMTLIDGNSRLIEAKEKGEKFIYVSIPSRKLTPKEFQEMSAMFDFAKAGEVDTDRIKKELGSTSDFFKKWNIEVPLALLDKMGAKRPASEIGDLEFPEEKNSRGVAQVSDIKMVQLFFSEKQEAEFRKIEEKLKAKFKTESTTETVLKAMKSIKIILLIMLLASCIPSKFDDKETSSISGFDVLKVMEVEGCEYIIYNGRNEGGIVHKANCKNIYHENKITNR